MTMHTTTALLLGALLGSPAAAITTVLDFSGDICGPNTNQGCGVGGMIGQGYGGNSDVAIDSISVTAAAIPEPASVALLLAGLGVVGWRARHRAR